MLATLAARGGGWERHSIGPGAHGDRVYDWIAVSLDPAGLPAGWGHWLLVRRQTETPPGKTKTELAFYRCAGPARTPLRELIRSRGRGGRSRSASRPRRTKPGWNQYQVRDWRAWHAHITLAMLAAAYLAATRAAEINREAEKGYLEPARTG